MTLRPSFIRYAIVFAAMLAAVLLYLERVCLSVAEVYIREDLRIGKDRMDDVLMAFFLAYALGQVPAGWLSQRFGPRLMMSIYMLGLAVFGVFIALSQNFWMLFIARFLLGLSQAGAYPTAALLIKRWVPDAARGKASSIVAFGGRFGGAWANYLTGILIVVFVPVSMPSIVTSTEMLNRSLIVSPTKDQLEAEKKTPALDPVRERVRASLSSEADDQVVTEVLNSWIHKPGAFDDLDWNKIALPVDGKAIREIPVENRSPEQSERFNRLVLEKAFPGAVKQIHVAGWRPTLLVYGALGLVMAGLFWILARNWPREHPWANAAEVQLIELGQSTHSEHATPDAIPWKALATSPNQWVYSTGQIFNNIGWVFLITLLPRFLDERYSVPVDQRSLMATLPLFAGALGMLVGGWFTDRLVRKIGLRWGRSIPVGLFKIPCVIALCVSPFLPTAWAVTLALVVMAASTDFGIPATWAFAQDTGGKQAATVLGWANMWGNLGAALGAKGIGLLATHYGWDAALFGCAVAFALSGTCGMIINAAQPLFRTRKVNAPVPEL